MPHEEDEQVTHTQILTVIEDVRKTLETVAEEVASTAEHTTEHSDILAEHSHVLKEIRTDAKDLKDASIDHRRRIEEVEKAVSG